jgi:hypothetical protein
MVSSGKLFVACSARAFGPVRAGHNGITLSLPRSPGIEDSVTSPLRCHRNMWKVSEGDSFRGTEALKPKKHQNTKETT